MNAIILEDLFLHIIALVVGWIWVGKGVRAVCRNWRQPLNAPGCKKDQQKA